MNETMDKQHEFMIQQSKRLESLTSMVQASQQRLNVRQLPARPTSYAWQTTRKFLDSLEGIHGALSGVGMDKTNNFSCRCGCKKTLKL